MTSIQIDRTDGLSSSVAIKGPCRVATTANVTLSGEQTIDGVAVVTDDRVLVKDQTTASENGIYVADTGAWRRAKDFSRTNDVKTGTHVYVTSGSVAGGGSFIVATTGAITIDTTSISFSTSPSLSSLGGSAAGIDGFKYDFDTVTLLIADTVRTYSNTTAGDYIRTRAEGFSYLVAASGASDHDVATGGGLKLYKQPVVSQTTPDGVGYWKTGDQSSKILGSPIASSSVNSGSGTITSVAHGLKTGFSVIVTAAVNGLSVNTLYRVIYVDADNFKLATTWANAKAGTNVTLTGTTATTVKQHYDPLQAKYITPTADISGASGATVRHGDVTPYHAGADGGGVVDDTEAVQNILTVSRGKTAHIADGQFKITLPLWTVAEKTHICLSHDAEIIHNTSDYIALNLAHAKCRVSGGKGGGWTGPASFDPGTGVTFPTYGVLWATADGCEVEGTRITNVRRIGIGFKDANRWSVKDCVIDGNVTTPTFPLTTTFHFGIFGDPSSTTGLGKIQVSGNEISGCVTGVAVGNYGSGPANARSLLIHGNVFEDMWDHCVYTNYSGGAVITDNTSHRCHAPVACSGPNNIVEGWTVYTEAGSPDGRDIASAISFRDAVGCIARNITVRGHGDSVSGQTVIAVDFINVGSVPMNGNLVDGIRVENLSGAAQAVRINASVGHYGNAISNVFFDGIPRDALGVVAIEGAVGYGVSIDHIHVIQKGGLAIAAVLGRFANSRITNIQHELAFDQGSGSPTTAYGVYLYDSLDTVVDGVQPYNRATYGEYITYYGVYEGTAAARNEASNVKDMEALATGQAFVHAVPLSSASKMLLRLAGGDYPSFAARAGSVYYRYGGTNAQWRNTADGNNWVDTWP